VMPNGAAAGEAVSLSIRPENVEVYKKMPPPPVAEPMNLFAGRIDVVVFQGAAVRLLIHMEGEEIISDIIEKEFQQRDLKQGDEVSVYFAPDAFMVFPEEGGKR